MLKVLWRSRKLSGAPSRSIVKLLDLRSVLVVAAHPDDEAIGAWALMGRLSSFGIVHVTDGAPRDGRDARAKGFASWEQYRLAREAEAAAALALQNGKPELHISLEIPDQDAAFHVPAIARRLAEILRDAHCDAVVTHAYEGGHPDHDATALAVHAAIRLLERSHRAPHLIEMAGYHNVGGHVVFGAFIPRAGAGPLEILTLREDERAKKEEAFAAYASQADVLARFPLDAETFRVAPRYDFLSPPHTGKLNYETFGWPLDGRRWRRAAKAALRDLDLLADGAML